MLLFVWVLWFARYEIRCYSWRTFASLTIKTFILSFSVVWNIITCFKIEISEFVWQIQLILLSVFHFSLCLIHEHVDRMWITSRDIDDIVTRCEDWLKYFVDFYACFLNKTFECVAFKRINSMTYKESFLKFFKKKKNGELLYNYYYFNNYKLLTSRIGFRMSKVPIKK